MLIINQYTENNGFSERLFRLQVTSPSPQFATFAMATKLHPNPKPIFTQNQWNPKPIPPRSMSQGWYTAPTHRPKQRGALTPPEVLKLCWSERLLYILESGQGKGQNTYLFGEMDGFLRSKTNKEKTSHSSIAAAYHYMPCAHVN